MTDPSRFIHRLGWDSGASSPVCDDDQQIVDTHGAIPIKVRKFITASPCADHDQQVIDTHGAAESVVAGSEQVIATTMVAPMACSVLNMILLSSGRIPDSPAFQRIDPYITLQWKNGVSGHWGA